MSQNDTEFDDISEEVSHFLGFRIVVNYKQTEQQATPPILPPAPARQQDQESIADTPSKNKSPSYPPIQSRDALGIDSMLFDARQRKGACRVQARRWNCEASDITATEIVERAKKMALADLEFSKQVFTRFASLEPLKEVR